MSHNSVHIDNAFYPTPTGENTTMNQEYDKAVAQGKFFGTFKDWMGHAEDKGWLDKGVDTLGKIKGFFGKNQQVDYTTNTNDGEGRKPFAVSGTTKTLLIIGGSALVIVIGYAIYKVATRVKK